MLHEGETWSIHHGDCIEHMATMPPACIDFSVFSPPFPSVYAYTSSDRDIGNSEDLAGEGKLHLSYFYRQLLRIIKPGRVVMVHVAQIPRMKRTGGQGMHDFRGLNIRLGERAGFVYEYDWLVTKNPQSQAIRTKSRELQFSGLESDRARSRGCMPDYLIKFTAPGENAVPVRDWEPVYDAEGEVTGKRPLHDDQVTRNDWIDMAEAAWTGIRETDTLNVRGTKGENDTKHICPLQIPVIDRLVRLYTNPGEVVFSPFTGIGSEGWVAVKNGRRFYGCELKDEYHATACKNIADAERLRDESTATLFDSLENIDEPQEVEA